MTTTLQGMLNAVLHARPSRWGWALLLLALIVAAGLRFWRLGELPSGFYFDEGSNGLDALRVLNGELDGQSPFWFPDNNGREPLFIYLVSLAVGLLGRSVVAVRLPAAIVGTLTTWFTYKLASAWFGRRVGLLSAWIWAITLLPIHISRIGFRAILLPLFLTLIFWLGTLAYRRSESGQPSIGLWILTGMAVGVSIYTYLPVRISPVLFVSLIIYMAFVRKQRPLYPGLVWAAVVALVAIAPMALLAWQQPEVIWGRIEQVYMLNPAVGGEVFPGPILRQLWQALGMFVVSGDSIWRHNLPGRPIFDIFLALPFLIGVFWCLRYWRNPPAAVLLVWVGVMLIPTILAEDAPHFLRAIGILPAVVMYPAIGLSQLSSWSRLPQQLGKFIVVALMIGSLVLTVRDYYYVYWRQPTAAYWFDAATYDLALEINEESEGTKVYLDQRLWTKWPNLRFLVQPDRQLTLYKMNESLPESIDQPAAIYAWPYEKLETLAETIAVPSLVAGETGSLMQGDLEPEPYPLYVRYTADRVEEWPILANFDNSIQLRRAELTDYGGGRLQIDLYWSTDTSVEWTVVAFVHVVAESGLIAQSDSVPSQGNWPAPWWRQGLIIRDRHELTLPEDYDRERHQLKVGLYHADGGENLPLVGSAEVGDTWLMQP